MSLCRVCALPTAHPRGWYCSPICRVRSKTLIAENGCWIWTGPVKPGRYPYGLISNGRRRTVIVHRFVYETMVGTIPENNVIMHTCGNALCVNPQHLKAGTQSENVAEQIARGVFQKPLGFQQAIEWMRHNRSTDLVAFLAHHFDRTTEEVIAAI